MKFYSEKTGLLYDSEKALNAAELKLAKQEADEKAEKEKATAKIARDIGNILELVKKATAANEEVEENIDKYYDKYQDNTPACNALKTALKTNGNYNLIFTKKPSFKYFPSWWL